MKKQILCLLLVLLLAMPGAMAQSVQPTVYYTDNFYSYWNFPNYFQSNSVTYSLEELTSYSYDHNVHSITYDVINVTMATNNTNLPAGSIFRVLPGQKVSYDINSPSGNHSSFLFWMNIPLTGGNWPPNSCTGFNMTIYFQDGTSIPAQYLVIRTQTIPFLPIYHTYPRLFVGGTYGSNGILQGGAQFDAWHNGIATVPGYQATQAIYMDTAVLRTIPVYYRNLTLLGYPIPGLSVAGPANSSYTDGFGFIQNPSDYISIRNKQGIVAESSTVKYPEPVRITFDLNSTAYAQNYAGTIIQRPVDVVVVKYDWSREQFEAGVNTVGKPYENANDLMSMVTDAVATVMSFLGQVLVVAGILKFFLIDYWYLTLAYVEMFAALIALRRARGDVFRFIIAFVAVNVSLLTFAFGFLEAVIRIVEEAASIGYNLLKSIPIIGQFL